MNEMSVVQNLVEPKSLLEFISFRLDAYKAEDVVFLNTSEEMGVVRYMVIASGNSSRHVASMAENLLFDAKHCGYVNINVEGKIGASSWVLLDFVSIVVHLFRREARSYYRLEELWMEERGLQKV